MAKIGTSLTECLLSIAKGEVKISEIEFIITSTQYRTREELVEGVTKKFRGRDVQKHIDNASYLWSSGRIFQSFNLQTYKRYPTTLWIDIPPLFRYK